MCTELGWLGSVGTGEGEGIRPSDWPQCLRQARTSGPGGSRGSRGSLGSGAAPASPGLWRLVLSLVNHALQLNAALGCEPVTPSRCRRDSVLVFLSEP